MTVVVEDGSGKPDANSYVPVEYADAYFALRGNETWLFEAEDKKLVAIVQATDYVDARWGYILDSTPTTEEQALLFPRKKWEGMPDTLKKAVCEYALRALLRPLMPDPTVDDSGQVVIKTEEKVGPITEKKEFMEPSPGITWPVYTSADALMRPLLRAGAGSGRVVRNG